MKAISAKGGHALMLSAVLAMGAMPVVALAAGGKEKQAAQRAVENSMLVTGTIDIDVGGGVTGYHLDQPDELPAPVKELVAKAVPALRFEPPLVDGKPTAGRAKMGLRIVARQLANGNYGLRVASTSFGNEKGVPGEEVTSRRLTPPKYPAEAYSWNMSGTVYLLLKIGRDGQVQDVATEQVNLTAIGSESEMARARKLLADASTSTARRWRFEVPTRGPAAADPYWKVRVPVSFSFKGRKAVAYGQWDAYVPGPRTRPAWADDKDAEQSPDALIAGTVQQLGSGPRLLTPPGQG